MLIKSYDNQPHFGMSMKFSRKAAINLECRTTREGLQKIKELRDEFKNKETNIFFYTQKGDSTRILADITSGKKRKTRSEGMFYIFRDPANFIASVCKEADKLEKNVKL